jgi:hypothetical protein
MTYSKKKSKKSKAMTPERIDELLRQDQEKVKQLHGANDETRRKVQTPTEASVGSLVD